MRGRLFSPVGELRVDQTFEAEAVIGRARDNTIVLASGYLSGCHARIAWRADAGCYFLEDLGSSNGTALDGEPVVEPEPLGHLHVITLADRYDFVFQDLDLCGRRHAPDGAASAEPGAVSRTSIKVLDLPLPDLLKQSGTAPSERTLLQKLALPLPSFLRGSKDEPSVAKPPEASPPSPPSPPSSLAVSEPPPASPITPTGPETEVRKASWTLEVPHDDGTVERHALGEGEHVVGRTVSADIRIRSPEISRRHARLRVRDGRLSVCDLGSSNGTFVDDVRIEGEADLDPGRRLRFGAFETRIIVGGFSDSDRPIDRRSPP